jgi:hypothetical protein
VKSVGTPVLKVGSSSNADFQNGFSFGALEIRKGWDVRLKVVTRSRDLVEIRFAISRDSVARPAGFLFPVSFDSGFESSLGINSLVGIAVSVLGPAHNHLNQ